MDSSNAMDWSPDNTYIGSWHDGRQIRVINNKRAFDEFVASQQGEVQTGRSQQAEVATEPRPVNWFQRHLQNLRSILPTWSLFRRQTSDEVSAVEVAVEYVDNKRRRTMPGAWPESPVRHRSPLTPKSPRRAPAPVEPASPSPPPRVEAAVEEIRIEPQPEAATVVESSHGTLPAPTSPLTPTRAVPIPPRRMRRDTPIPSRRAPRVVEVLAPSAKKRGRVPPISAQSPHPVLRKVLPDGKRVEHNKRVHFNEEYMFKPADIDPIPSVKYFERGSKIGTRPFPLNRPSFHGMRESLQDIDSSTMSDLATPERQPVTPDSPSPSRRPAPVRSSSTNNDASTPSSYTERTVAMAQQLMTFPTSASAATNAIYDACRDFYEHITTNDTPVTTITTNDTPSISPSEENGADSVTKIDDFTKVSTTAVEGAGSPPSDFSPPPSISATSVFQIPDESDATCSGSSKTASKGSRITPSDDLGDLINLYDRYFSISKRTQDVRRKKAEAELQRLEEERRRCEEEERKLQRVVVDLSADWNDKVDKAMNSHPTKPLGPAKAFTRRDLGTLLPQSSQEGIGWLNDEIINQFIQHIVDDRLAKAGYKKSLATSVPTHHAFNSNLYNTWRSKGYAGVARWAKRAKIDGTRLLQVEKCLIPINNNSHWTEISISGTARTIEYYDSLWNNPGKYTAFALDFVQNVLGDAFVAEEWKIVDASSSQQANGVDCGVFVCMNALSLALGREPWVAFPAEDAAAARRMIAAVLLNGGFSGDFELA